VSLPAAELGAAAARSADGELSATFASRRYASLRGLRRRAVRTVTEEAPRTGAARSTVQPTTSKQSIESSANARRDRRPTPKTPCSAMSES
jgi:hypothetical protein